MFQSLAIKQSDVDDVREVLRYYKQYDDPIEAFRENQRKLQVMKFEILLRKYESEINVSNIKNMPWCSGQQLIFIFRKLWLLKSNFKKKRKPRAKEDCFHLVCHL